MSNTTELVFILDRNGSMAGLEADTIGGFNSMIAKQKKETGAALVSTILFDNESVVIHDRLPLEKVPPMTEAEYFTRGCTALLDAVGGPSAISQTSTNTPGRRTCRKRRCSSSRPTAVKTPVAAIIMSGCGA